jgi:hypothetical protein
LWPAACHWQVKTSALLNFQTPVMGTAALGTAKLSYTIYVLFK